MTVPSLCLAFNSPPARCGLLDFIRALLLFFSSLPSPLLSSPLLSSLLSSPLLSSPRLLDNSTSTASSRSQWATPQLHARDRSGRCPTSTASARSQWARPDHNRKWQIAVGAAGPQPPAPDRSGRCRTAPDHSGHCWTSTASSRSQWALPDLNGQLL